MRNLELFSRFILLTIVALLSLECYQTGELKNDIENIPASSDVDTDTDADRDTQCVVNGRIWLVEQVEGWVDETDGSTTIFLKTGEELHIEAGQRSREAWFIWIEWSLERGEPSSFFVALPNNTVLDVEHTSKYTVEWVKDDPAKDHVEIAFNVSAAVHTLQRDHRCFDRFLTLIKQSLETEEPLLVTEVDNEGNLWTFGESLTSVSLELLDKIKACKLIRSGTY